MFSAGDIFIWRNFPYIRDEDSDKKDRYFVFLGRTGPLSTPLFVYICTTTGKIEKYQPGECRCRNDFIKIPENMFGFTTDCILDLTINYYDEFTVEDLSRFASDLQVVGKLSEEYIRRVYKLICGCRGISRIQKRDIHKSFNLVGIRGLKQP